MLLIPALDLYKGKAVRFTKGDPLCSKVYSNDPVSVAKKWDKTGARLLHLVDLSAALGEGDNKELIKDVLKEVNLEVEVGGGIRSIDKAGELLSWGAKRVIFGTRGLESDFLAEAIRSLGRERLAVSIDAFGSCVAAEGWQKKTKFDALNLAVRLIGQGIRWLIYTDISRDGTLEGPNYAPAKKLSAFPDVNLILSGGVASLDDLERIKEAVPFVWGVILGKALYEERIDFREASKLFQ